MKKSRNRSRNRSRFLQIAHHLLNGPDGYQMEVVSVLITVLITLPNVVK